MKEVYIVNKKQKYIYQQILSALTSKSQKTAQLSKKIGKRCSKSQMARFMARNSKWPENIFYGQRGTNMARFEKSGHQMANLAALRVKSRIK